MKLLYVALPVLLLCLLLPCQNTPQAAGEPDLAELTEPALRPGSTTPSFSACTRYNELNTRIRDGKIGRAAAQTELKRLLAKVRETYYQGGGSDHAGEPWVFPLAGYTSQAMSAGKNNGYISHGYEFFSGNRHGGHPAVDIFIHDRNQASLDDRSGKPVKVLSLTSGIVVALEQEWQQGSELRGGRYLWVYDPANELLIYYAHNSKLFVKLGEIVKPGDLLASVGRSGYNAAKRRSPSHLHLSVLRVKDGRPLPLNPCRELMRARMIADQEKS